MNAKHTPGPWQVVLEMGLPRVVSSHGLRVADALVDGGIGTLSNEAVRDEVAANARLMAMAPEMRRLLLAAVEVLDAPGIVYGDTDCEPLDVLREARALLAEIDGAVEPARSCAPFADVPESPKRDAALDRWRRQP